MTTSDGYRLGIHRCSGGPLSPPALNKPVAFLMHGQLSSSADYVIMGPNNALVYMLADLGWVNIEFSQKVASKLAKPLQNF